MPIRLSSPSSLSTCAGTAASFAISGGFPPYELWSVPSFGSSGWQSARNDALGLEHSVLLSGIDSFAAQSIEISWPPQGSVRTTSSFAVFDSTGRGSVDGDGSKSWEVTNVVCRPVAPPPTPGPARPPLTSTSPSPDPAVSSAQPVLSSASRCVLEPSWSSCSLRAVIPTMHE